MKQLFTLLIIASFISQIVSQTAGGLTTIEFKPDTNQLDGMAYKALQNYLKQNSEFSSLQLKQVVNAQTQVVSGIKYKLTVQLTNTQNQLLTYIAEIWVKQWQNFAQVTSFTKSIIGDETSSNEKAVQLAKTTVENKFELLNDYNCDSYEILDKQVVSGLLLTIKLIYVQKTTQQQRIFTVSVWARPWLNSYEVTDIQEQKNLSESKINKEEILETAALKAVEAIRLKTNLLENLYPYENYTIISVKTQNGLIYEMKITFKSIQNPSSKKEFRVKVLVKPWADEYQVQSIQPFKENTQPSNSTTDQQSSSTQQNQQIDGAWSDSTFDLTDSYNQQILTAMNSYIQKQNGMSNIKIDQVLKCRKQIVSGINYKIIVKLSNGSKAELKIYTRSWTNTIDIQEFQIFSSNDTQLLGGWKEVNMKDLSPDAISALSKTLDNYFKKNSLYTTYSKFLIKKLEQQQVNGMKYKAYLELFSANPAVSATYSATALIVIPLSSKSSSNTGDVVEFQLPHTSAQSQLQQQIDQQQNQNNSRNMIGGYTNIQFDQLKQQTRQSIINEINSYLQSENSQSVQGFIFDSVISAQSQVVNGVNYKLKVQITKNDQQAIIEVIAYVQTYANNVRISKFTIVQYPDLRRRLRESQFLGKWKILNETEIQNDKNILEKALLDYFESLNENVTIKGFTNVEKQIISGNKYRFQVEYLTSTGETQKAEVSIWSQSWTNMNRVLKFKIIEKGE